MTELNITGRTDEEAGENQVVIKDSEGCGCMCPDCHEYRISDKHAGKHCYGFYCKPKELVQ